jgi:tellurite resistance protein
MARRRKSGFLGAVILLGLCLVVINAAAQFVQDNWLEIRALLILTACFLVLGLIVRIVWWLKRPGPGDRVQHTLSQMPPASVPLGTSGETRQARQSSDPPRWVMPGEMVTIQGMTVSSGLFYVSLAKPGSIDHAGLHGVVFEQLPITKERADVEGSTMPYWPSYSSITPSARRAFLEWMVGGRKDPAYGVGHVFMFFYGLERRFFHERCYEDGPSIFAEVNRLLSIYGDSNSFKQYAGEFLIQANLALGRTRTPRLTRDLLDQRSGPNISADVRLHLGRKLAATNALGPDDALIWLLSAPGTTLRTAAVRCFDEFVALWRLRFTNAFPDGFLVDLPKERLHFRYRASSGDFEVDIPGQYQNLPDINGLSAPVSLLDRLAQACTDELDPFSRYLGRQPNGRESVHGALLLPHDLQTEVGSTAFQKLKGDLAEVFGQRDTAALTMRRLMEIAGFEPPNKGKISKAVTEEIGRILDRIDVGIEPDVRYGGGAPTSEGDQVLIFRASRGGPIDAARPEYRAMRAQVEVAALAAAADGEAGNEDFQTIMSLVRGTPGLSRIEQVRLFAYSVTLFKSPLKQARVMKRLADCTETERQSIAKAAALVIGAKGQPGPDEVKFLERLHKTLGLSRESAYAELHRATESLDEPAVVASEQRTPGIPIPSEIVAPVLGQSTSINIDPAKLARVQRETQAVSDLLMQIFADEEKPAPVAPTVNPIARSSFDGLDVDHGTLLEAVLANGGMPRAEFDTLARKAKLLPDGALETINDWAYDRLDEPLIEDSDPIRIPPDLRDRLAELKEAS